MLRDTVRSHHVLLGILSKDNAAGGPDLLAELGIGIAEARVALADEIGHERDTGCAFCSFCRKPRFDVKLLVPSAFSQICDECVGACKAHAGRGTVVERRHAATLPVLERATCSPVAPTAVASRTSSPRHPRPTSYADPASSGLRPSQQTETTNESNCSF